MAIMIRLFRRVALFVRWFRLKASGTTVGEALGGLGVPKNVREALSAIEKGASASITKVGQLDQFMQSYNPDEIVDQFNTPVLNPVFALHEAIRTPDKCTPGNHFAGENPKIKEAWLYEERVDGDGKRPTNPKVIESMRREWPLPHKIRRVVGHEAFKQALQESEDSFRTLPSRVKAVREAQDVLRKVLKEDGFFDGAGGTQYDVNQYNEYVPLTGGPFFRQLYIYDFLKQIAYAFEAQNHNPVAKAIINILVSYAFGRRFEVRVMNDRKKKIWDEFDRTHKIVKMFCRFWAKEIEVYGDFFYDKKTKHSIDPSTVWDIITEPDDIEQQYYLYQSYPTQYQMFSGMKVPGAPGSASTRGSEYIVRQIPMSQVIHIKINCMSNEKRGRSRLFSILGWLKRIKDLYNAQVIREWLYSSFVWDVEIDGNAADVSSYASQFPNMPSPGSPYIHNKAVKLSPMAALPTAGTRGGSGISAELLGFIANACQIPKEFLNVISSGGGSRAQALTAAEPFTKMVEDIQSTAEEFLTEIFKSAIEDAGEKYEEGDVEFLFPSVTKDTTTETIKNLVLAESQGYLSKRTAAEMTAKELNITSYDFEDEQAIIKEDEADGFNLTGQPLAPAGRFGEEGDQEDDEKSEIHGQGKVDLEKDLKTL